jgi:hypothetical protein
MERRCRLCFKHYPLTAEYFHRTAQKGCSGYKYECKRCRQPPRPCAYCGTLYSLFRGCTAYCCLECRFWSQVDKTGPCWLWKGACETSGYGHICWAGDIIRVHRYSLELHGGSLAGGLQALHTCDTPSCVNPEHLYAGTHEDNMFDKVKRNRAGRLPGERPSADVRHYWRKKARDSGTAVPDTILQSFKGVRSWQRSK